MTKFTKVYLTQSNQPRTYKYGIQQYKVIHSARYKQSTIHSNGACEGYNSQHQFLVVLHADVMSSVTMLLLSPRVNPSTVLCIHKFTIHYPGSLISATVIHSSVSLFSSFLGPSLVILSATISCLSSLSCFDLLGFLTPPVMLSSVLSLSDLLLHLSSFSRFSFLFISSLIG